MSDPREPARPSGALPEATDGGRIHRSWNDFLPILSRAIRTPLNGILGLSRLLVDGQLAAEERRNAELLHSSAESLLLLIDELLDLSKIETGQLSLDEEDFRLRDLVRQTVEPQQARARSKRLDLRYRVADGAPEELRGDARRLRQVLFHLIDNGIRFTRRGFVLVNVEREVRDATPNGRARLRFAVTDSGVGVGPELGSRIFEPFVQGSSSDTGSVGGNGLGLAISQGLVRLMGSELGFESTPGQGSVFSFAASFEPARDPQALAAPPAPAAAATASEGRRDGFRVLVAEDDEVNRLLALRVLAAAGYQADAVHDGIKALEALEEKRYDLVLMDCQMPELDGYEATRLLRQLEKGRHGDKAPHLPVIAVTALTSDKDKERCVEAGMDAFVAKPYRAGELVRAVDHQLGVEPATTAGGAPKAPSRGSPGSLDTDTFHQLRELTGSAQLLETLVETFVRDRRRRCRKLSEALEAGEGQRLAGVAHKLISASGSVGAYRLATLAGEMEISAREGRLEQCRTLLGELVAEYEQAEKALRDVLEQGRAT